MNLSQLETENEMRDLGSEEEQAAEFTVIGGRRGRKPNREQKQWWDSPLRRGELSRTLFHSFRFIGKLIRSTSEWEEDEFDEVSADLLELANRLPPVKFFFKVISPLVSISRLFEKVQKLVEGRQKKQDDSSQQAV